MNPHVKRQGLHLHDVGKAGLHHGTPAAFALHPPLLPRKNRWASPPRENYPAEYWLVRFPQQLQHFQHPGAGMQNACSEVLVNFGYYCIYLGLHLSMQCNASLR